MLYSYSRIMTQQNENRHLGLKLAVWVFLFVLVSISMVIWMFELAIKQWYVYWYNADYLFYTSIAVANFSMLMIYIAWADR